jgi:Phage tail lysozyme
MANTFNIVITATDKATATIKSVNDQFARLTRPFEQAGKSFKRFGQELGLDKVGKNVAKMGLAARTTAERVGSIITPLAAITSAASIGGVVALADSWAKMGRSVTMGAQALGVSSKEFQHMKNLGTISGAGAEAVTDAYGKLQTTMQDARWGRNQGALMAFNRVGVGLKLTKNGALDVKAQMEGLRKVIMSPEFAKDPAKQQVLAQAAGVEAMLPIWRQGEDAWKRYQATLAKVEYLSPATALADRLAESIAGLKIAAGGLGTAILDKVMPAVQPLVDGLTDWIVKNRELISQRVGEWAKGFADWVNSIDWKKVGAGITKFIEDIGKLVDMLGGWKNAAIAVVGVMNAGLILSVVKLTTAIAGPLLRGLVAVVSTLWSWATAASAAATATNAATTAGEAAAAVGGAGIKGLIGKAGLVAGAGAVGWEIGSQINKHFVEGTAFGDKLGEGIATIMAGLGNKEAQRALDVNQAAKLHDTAQKRAGANPRATKQAMDYFMSQGWTKAQAAGITANLLEESGLNPTLGGDYVNGKATAYGIGQWHKDRQDAFAKWAGHPIQQSTLAEQMGFVNFELTQGNERKAGALLKATQGAGMAGDAVSRFYERPHAVEDAAAGRSALAQVIAAGTYGAPADKAPTATAPVGPAAGAPGAAGAAGKVVVEFQNAPPGTKATVKSQTGDVQVQPRIGTTGVGSGP